MPRMARPATGTAQRTPNGSWPENGNLGSVYPADYVFTYSVKNGDTPEGIADVGPNLAPPIDGNDLEQQQVRLVRLKGLRHRPIRTGATPEFYQTKMVKPTIWNTWLRMKVNKLTLFLVEYLKPLRATSKKFGGGDPSLNSITVLHHFDWFVMLDDDTYIKVPQFTDVLTSLEPFPRANAAAVGRKFIKAPASHASRHALSNTGAVLPSMRMAAHWRQGNSAANLNANASALNNGSTAVDLGHSLLGGGPGIALSQRALHAIRAAKCYNRIFNIISSTVPGGDGWLGQCLEFSNVESSHDWRFKSLPPFAFSRTAASHAVTFHKSHLREAHAVVQMMNRHDMDSEEAGHATTTGSPTTTTTRTRTMHSWANLSNPICHPVLLRDLQRVQCLPRFVIIGAQKGGTTSLFSYLGQHPQVSLPEEKEMNFFGTPWPVSWSHPKMVTLGHFTFNYLSRFGDKLARPSWSWLDDGGGGGDHNSASGSGSESGERSRSGIWKRPPQRITGEASPDYLVTGRHILQNLLRFAPRMKVIVSLRDPVERAISAYANKVADGAVHRHLLRDLYVRRRVDKRDDATIAFASRVRLRKAELERNASSTTVMIWQAGAAAEAARSSTGDNNDTTTATNLERQMTQKIAAVPEPWTVPTIQQLVMEDLNATLRACPDQAKHYTMAEVPAPRNDGGPACYVNPFVLHGYYAKYLRHWAEVYTPLAVVSSGSVVAPSSPSGKAAGVSSQSHHYDHRLPVPSSSSSSSSSWNEAEVREASLLVVDFEELTHSEHRSAQTMDAVAAFLGLKPFNFRVGAVFNSRLNRGVHRGQVTGVAKVAMGEKLGSWLKDGANAAANGGLDAAATQLLRSYYRRPNEELRALLGKQLSWMSAL